MSELSLLQGRQINTEAGGPVVPHSPRRVVDTIDRYSGFDHRVSEGSLDLITPPAWVTSAEDRRRIVSYRVSRAAMETVTRFFHDREGLSSDYDQNREHGHAAAYIDRLVDAIIGEGAIVRVPGADVAVPPRPVLPRKPDDLPDDADPVEREAYDATIEFWQEEVRRVTAEWREKAYGHQDLVDRQNWMGQWARERLFWQHIYESEIEHVTPLGDGVLVLSICENNCPRVRAVSPDGFFKVWTGDDTSDQEFPARVHLAWEVRRLNDRGDSETWVRRITYELLEVEQPWQSVYQSGPTSKRCFYSEGEWHLDTIVRGRRDRPLDVDEFPLELAKFQLVRHPFDPDAGLIEANRVPLPIDFIPVVHVHHTLSGAWGRSAFARVMALLDDMAAADTAAALVANLNGEPPIAFSGGMVEEDMILGAAAAINLGTDGKVSKISFSEELRATIEYIGSLERQFMKMTTLSGELSGRENNEQSGRAIGLKMTPFRQTVLRSRLAREHQYNLVLKFVQRLALVADTDGFPGAEVMPAELKWGTFIPEDLSGLVEQVTLLRDRNLLTDDDVYDLLIDAGVRIKDPDASLEALRSINMKVAAPLAAILGRRAAAEFLGRTFDEEDPSLQASAPSRPTADARAGNTNPGSGSRNQVGPARQRSQPAPTDPG